MPFPATFLQFTFHLKLPGLYFCFLVTSLLVLNCKNLDLDLTPPAHQQICFLKVGPKCHSTYISLIDIYIYIKYQTTQYVCTLFHREQIPEQIYVVQIWRNRLMCVEGISGLSQSMQEIWDPRSTPVVAVFEGPIIILKTVNSFPCSINTVASHFMSTLLLWKSIIFCIKQI